MVNYIAGPSDGLFVFETVDGGRTWSTKSLQKMWELDDDSNLQSIIDIRDTDRILDEMSGWSRAEDKSCFFQTCEAIGWDNSIWELEDIDVNSGYKMRMKSQNAEHWEIEFAIPNRFVYSDGIIKVFEP